LVETLPTKGGKPYLVVLALMHADFDHIDGLGDLLDSGILVGELWVTPRSWREAAGAVPSGPCAAASGRHGSETKLAVT
jgi:hypothetical protein